MALLENGAEIDKEGKQLAEAVSGFRRISGSIPADPLGVQNLCVGLLLQLRVARNSASDSVADLERDFVENIQLVKKLAPDEVAGWILDARFHQDRGDLKRAEQLLRDALTKPNVTADVYFQLIELRQATESPLSPQESRELLELAMAKSPTNLVLSVAYLDSMAKLQDKQAYENQLVKCEQQFQPFVSRVGSQVPKLLDRIRTALEKPDWRAIQTQTTFVRNVLIAEIGYQNDLNLLRPHSLEYIRLSFSSPMGGRLIPATAPRFNRDDLGIDVKSVSAIAVEDVDLDGREDLVLAFGSFLQAWSFGKQAPRKLMELDCSMPVTGIVLADLDHDYQVRKESLPSSALPSTAAPDAAPNPQLGMLDTDVDAIVYGSEGLQLLENQLSSDKVERSWVLRPLSEEMASIKQVVNVAVIDFDHDSDLDLVVISKDRGISLWSNRGDWTFANFTDYSNLPETAVELDSVISWDADRNVLVDLFVGSDSIELPTMLGNNLHGRFHPRELAWPDTIRGCCRVIQPIDANADACWDLLTAGRQGVALLTMKSVGRRSWLPDSAVKLSDKPTIGLITSDFNNDGLTDALAWGNQGTELFCGQSAGKLTLNSNQLELEASVSQAVTLDIDHDGDSDVVLLDSSGNLRLFRNANGNQQQQMELVLRADEDGSQRPRERCNMHGVGSLVEVNVGGRYQSQIVRGTKTRFGLGADTTADVVRIVWTNGTPNNLLDVNNSSTVFDQQRLNGSCPYLYTWTGQRFEFFTDCLWAAPIGLQFGPGILAPTRDWEYLKIDGDALKPKDSKYYLQLTEELWEAAYFDAVQLMAIDHPAEIDVFTNEKVGPADIAQFRIYTVRRPLAPAAIDQAGRDQSELIASRDQRYAKSWTQGINQGLTEPHWLEIDLRAGGNSDQKVLFLTGWIFPTCTSLNMALAENPSRPELRPPALQVPDSSGNWVEVIPYTGFPGGKTKTIALDLHGKFLCDDHRVRIVSNMELCWDQIFYTVDERHANESDYRVQTLTLEHADLHYRGFSEQFLRAGNAPNYYDYNQVNSTSIWAPMSGSFTRYGEVTELLTDADDLQVVMGAGDEVTLRFGEAPQKLPEGWVRDFVIYNIGWDKDADLNTIHGQSVEPLPFRAMEAYPYAPAQHFPSTQKHLDFLEKYQTRLQSPGQFWNQVRDAL